MFEDIFSENLVLEDKAKKNFDELDAEVIRKLHSNEINVEETAKNLEKWYKGENIFRLQSSPSQYLRF